MSRIVAIPGSLRRGSYNAALLRAAAEVAPDGVTIEVASLHGIPLYDGDLEARDGIPEAVAALKERIAAADGLMIATPEYNNGIPGVLKNAVDWLSRPPADIERVFADRPVALLGATPGGFGTVLAQSAWLPVLRALRLRLWTGARMTVGGAGKVFDEQGRLADDELRGRLGEYVAGFAVALS